MASKPFPKAKDLEVPPPKPAEKATQAFTMLRKEGGWVMVTYTIEGDHIVSQVVTQPDLRILAMEQFKLAAYRWYTSQ